MKHISNIIGKKAAWLVGVMILSAAVSAWAYSEKSSNQNGVRVQVAPQELAVGKPVRFLIRLNTHTVELDQDLTKVSELRDSKGQTYGVVNWEGSPPGGHHRSGTLTFSELKTDSGEITLTLRDIGGVPERVFTWEFE